MSDSGFVWDAYQQYQIHELSKSAEAVKDIVSQDLGAAEATIERLEGKLDRLALLTRGVYELLQECGGVTDEQLAAKVSEIDLRDGNEDGKVTPSAKPCPKCDSMICVTFNRCLFCGYEDVTGDPFNAV